ncbi:MAG: hypothetical protein JSS09_01535, partial [Verrucomicrobia bacterium]|nr:hypothetical protein [Verrucomicrobiota bacterium]
WIEKAPTTLTEPWTCQWEKTLQEQFFWIPIGGCMKEGFFGALTLALDLLVNEQESNNNFSRIYIDSGTGLTASALILGWAYIQKKTPITVVLLAGTKTSFLEGLSYWKSFLEDALQESMPVLDNYQLTFPTTAKSFGSCNTKVFETIAKVAREEGIFLDPIYTVKLYLTAKETQEKTALWIHSGGALSLTGFQEPLLRSACLNRVFLNNLLKEPT